MTQPSFQIQDALPEIRQASASSPIETTHRHPITAHRHPIKATGCYLTGSFPYCILQLTPNLQIVLVANVRVRCATELHTSACGRLDGIDHGRSHAAGEKRKHKVNSKELQFVIEGKLSRKNIKKKNASNQIKSDLPTLVPIGPLRQL